jgi:outer membrane protein OmpA-like peptidoglycan-associated protein
MSTTFKKKGDYTVQLGLLTEKDSMGVIPKICVMKKIRIYNDYQELVLKGETKDNNEIGKTDSPGEQNKTLQIRIHFMDDLSERQKTKIRESFKDPGTQVVRFDQYGVKPSSYQFLSSIAGVLKENPDIRLELVLNAAEDERSGNKMGISEKWSRELGFYFKNKKVDMSVLNCKGFSSSGTAFEPYVADSKTIDGVIEFVFMKK